MGVYYDFDEVDAFTVGAVGRPGQRLFMFQARRGGERVTVKCEKQQAAAISDYLRKLLHDLPPPDDRPMPGALELTEPSTRPACSAPSGGYDGRRSRRAPTDEFVTVDDEGAPMPRQSPSAAESRVPDRGRWSRCATAEAWSRRGGRRAVVQHAEGPDGMCARGELMADRRPNSTAACCDIDGEGRAVEHNATLLSMSRSVNERTGIYSPARRTPVGLRAGCTAATWARIV